MLGRALPRVIVPLTLKSMVSALAPARQSRPVISLSLSALLMASRSVQLPSPAVTVSARLLTVRLAAQAGVPHSAAKFPLLLRHVGQTLRFEFSWHAPCSWLLSLTFLTYVSPFPSPSLNWIRLSCCSSLGMTTSRSTSVISLLPGRFERRGFS
jgi:hypothetical protein